MEMRKARLAEIEVDEVSYVDKAANKKTFIFVKRDISNDSKTEGGDSLLLIKRFMKNQSVIDALESFEKNFTAIDAEFDKLEKADGITAEEKEALISKRRDLQDVRNDFNEQFEFLFLDKSSKDEDEEDEEEDEEEMDKVEHDEEEADEADEDDEAEAEAAKKKETKKSLVTKDSGEEAEGDEDSEFDSEEQGILDEITKTVSETNKNIEVIKALKE